MTLHAYLLFLPACFALNMAFGPNSLLSVTYGARYGIRTAALAGLGRLLAFAFMISLAGLGMGTLLLASETAFTLVKLAGATYLIWLGVRLLRAPAPMNTLGLDRTPSSTPPPIRTLARQEFMVAIGNPKAILIFTAFLPQFAVPEAYAVSYIEVAITFLLLEWLTVALYAGLGRRMSRMSAGGQAMRWLNRASGTMMVLFGLLLALARRPAN